jgi:hypothetical protein
MLYARCFSCRMVVPLWCSGRFMPHMPQPVAATPMGACCPACGVLPPVFVCGFCWAQQILVLPGTQPFASPVPGQSQPMAYTVTAPPNAPEKKLLAEFAKSLGEGLVKGIAQVVSN